MIKNLVFVLILFALGYAPLYAMAGPRLRRMIGPHFAISFCVITALEFVLPDALYFFPALLVIFVVSVRDRMDALCRYVLLTALVPFVGWSAHIGSAFIGQFYVPDVLGLGLLIALRLKRDGAAKGPRGLAAEDWAILVMFLIMWIGIGRFPSASGFLRNMVVQGMLLLFPFWLLRRSVRDLSEFHDLIAAVAASTILLAVYAVYEAHASWAMFDYVSMHLGANTGMSKNAGLRGGILRASATMLTPLNLACWMSLGLLALACTRRYFRNGAAYWGFVALAFLGLLAPQSRGNLVCVAFGAVVLAMMWRKWGYVTATLVASGIGAATLFAAAKVFPRVAAFLNLDSQPVAGQYYDYRQLLLHRGLQEGMRHPLFGMSLNDVFDRLSDIQQGEHIVDLVNTYLTFFLTAGLAGMVPLVVLLAHALRKASVGFPPRIEPTLNAVRGFCVAGLCVVLVELAFMSFIDRVPFMLVLTLVGTRLVSANKRAAWSQARAARRRTAVAAPFAMNPHPA